MITNVIANDIIEESRHSKDLSVIVTGICFLSFCRIVIKRTSSSLKGGLAAQHRAVYEHYLYFLLFLDLQPVS